MSNMTQILGSNPLLPTLMQQGQPLDVLAQQTPSSANFSPDMQVPPFPPTPDKSPMTAMGSAPQFQTPQQQMVNSVMPQQPQTANVTAQPKQKEPIVHPYENEANGILRILGERLREITKQEMRERRGDGGKNTKSKSDSI